MDCKERIEAAKEQLKAADAVEYKLPDSAHAIRTAVYAIYPELRESEDERIRKEILQSIRDNMVVIHKDECIAWLEKQGNQKSVDKVEPKFKVGKWYIDNEDGTIFQIVKVLNNTYTYKTNEGKEYSCSHYSLENDAHLWTIDDAKLGNVLTNGKMIVIFKHFEEPSYRQRIVAYIGLDNNGDIQITDDTWTLGIDKAKPATKEQRDTLFKKMKEAGYTFDFEKKELKKIEQNDIMVEALRTEYEKGRADAIAQMQKEWSEEDEVLLSSIINSLEMIEGSGASKMKIEWLKSFKNRVISQPKQEWSEEDEKKRKRIMHRLSIDGTINNEDLADINEWLKSLRLQSHWKPSELPHWKKSSLPNDKTTGFNSDNFCYNGYYINYKELFDKLPKDD